MKRRAFLGAATLGVAGALWPPAVPAAASHGATTRGARVVIGGGGWGGLTAARYLRQLAPEIDVTLLERNASFWSCALSNRWLVGQVDQRLLTHDYAAAASAFGYRFVHAEARAIDRAARRVMTSAGDFDYDWLVLGIGIRHDYAAWFGADRETADHARERYPPVFSAGPEFALLRQKIESFKGGDFVMLLPPSPYRCPPAPYERAVLLAGWFDARKIPGRLIVVDPGMERLGFAELFRERYAHRIDYRPQTRVHTVDPRRRCLRTEFDDIEFDDAILMPPQQAGHLAWQAGLIGRAADGRPSGWAAADPLTGQSRADERVFVVGDMLDQVSQSFGHYPKTGQMASRQGRNVARHIIARIRGTEPPLELPDSTCHVATRYDPPETMRIESTFRLGPAGELVQRATLKRNPDPHGEDIAWTQEMFGEFLALP